MQTHLVPVKPAMFTTVNPGAPKRLSATVTVPTVGDVPELVTVIRKLATACPCVKLPLWVLVMVRSGCPEENSAKSDEVGLGGGGPDSEVAPQSWFPGPGEGRALTQALFTY